LDSNNLIAQVLRRIFRFKILIVLLGFLLGALLYYYAKKQPVIYTVKSTFYPLSTPTDKNSSTTKLTELIGGKGGGGGGNLSDEANVNIEEVAKSRKTRDAVCAEKLKEFDNKTLGEILIKEYNKQAGYFTEKLEMPKTPEAITTLGSQLLDETFTAKFNKQNLLELAYTNKNKELLTPVSYILIAKISQFYKELKIKKAKIDYDFMQMKYDSLSNVLNNLDQKQIALNERTLFVKNKIKYMIPEQNIENDRLQILAQKNNAAANVEEAQRRLQKVTPIIEILDTPEPPFKSQKTSAIIYGLVGFAAGIVLGIFLFTVGLFFKFANHQVSQTIESKLADNPKPSEVKVD
jgi:hypothetical protein